MQKLVKLTAAALSAAALFLCLFGCVEVIENAEHTVVDVSTAAPAVTEAPTEEPTQEPTAEPTAAPTQEPTPVPTAAPTPEPTQIPVELMPSVPYKSRVNSVNIRAAANTQSDIVGSLGFEEPVDVVGQEGDFYKVRYNGRLCYCYAKYLVPEYETLYGYMPRWTEYQTDKDGNIVYEQDGSTPVVLNSELIDVRLFIDNIEIYQIFGTEENFTGQLLYHRPVPVMQLPTVIKLADAARAFAEDGYTIKLYDCYRPKSVQFILYDIVNDSRYIANPYNSASNHNRAAAIDMTLIGPDGVELEFPTPMHTFGRIVHRDSADQWTAVQSANVDYMTEVMAEHGFRTITTEWWHFSDTDYPTFVVMDIDMRDIPMYTASQIARMANLEARGLKPIVKNVKIKFNEFKPAKSGGEPQTPIPHGGSII